MRYWGQRALRVESGSQASIEMAQLTMAEVEEDRKEQHADHDSWPPGWVSTFLRGMAEAKDCFP